MLANRLMTGGVKSTLYTTPGSYTFTVPTGVTQIRITAVGAGGKGGYGSGSPNFRQGGGGGSAGAIRATYNVTGGTSVSVFVGSGVSQQNTTVTIAGNVLTAFAGGTGVDSTNSTYGAGGAGGSSSAGAGFTTLSSQVGNTGENADPGLSSFPSYGAALSAFFGFSSAMSAGTGNSPGGGSAGDSSLTPLYYGGNGAVRIEWGY